MLTGISLVCFSTSYAITLALEVSRLFFRMPIRMVVMLLFAVVGLVTQGLYLYNRATDPALASVPLSNWHDWYVIAALVLAVLYVYLAASRPQTSHSASSFAFGAIVRARVWNIIAMPQIRPQEDPMSQSRACPVSYASDAAKGLSGAL